MCIWNKLVTVKRVSRLKARNRTATSLRGSQFRQREVVGWYSMNYDDSPQRGSPPAHFASLSSTLPPQRHCRFSPRDDRKSSRKAAAPPDFTVFGYIEPKLNFYFGFRLLGQAKMLRSTGKQKVEYELVGSDESDSGSTGSSSRMEAAKRLERRAKGFLYISIGLCLMSLLALTATVYLRKPMSEMDCHKVVSPHCEFRGLWRKASVGTIAWLTKE